MVVGTGKRRLPRADLLRLVALIVISLVAMTFHGRAIALTSDAAQDATIELADGSYLVDVAMTGGTGRASIESPAVVSVENGHAVARIVWSSPHYDYMLVAGERYLPVNESGNSVFEIPVLAWDEPFDVVGDTTAMSQPHEIDYQLQFDSASAVSQQGAGQSQGARFMLVGVALVTALVVLTVVLRRRKRA